MFVLDLLERLGLVAAPPPPRTRPPPDYTELKERMDRTESETPPDGIPTPKAVHDIRIDLLRALAALDLTREAAVAFREAANGAIDGDAKLRATRLLGDPEFLRQEVAKRLGDDHKWLLPLLTDLRPKA